LYIKVGHADVGGPTVPSPFASTRSTAAVPTLSTILFLTIMRIALGLAFLVSFAVAVSGHFHDHVPRKHLVRRGGDALLNKTTILEKRFDGAKFSYYAAGLGACGRTNTDNDFVSGLCSLCSVWLIFLHVQIVALNSAVRCSPRVRIVQLTRDGMEAI
jgi:hypothetical protein